MLVTQHQNVAHSSTEFYVKMMTMNYSEELIQRQKQVEDLLEGDANVIKDLHEHFQYIAELSARYVFYRISSRIGIEELEQQAHYEMLRILHRICGSDKEGLAKINDNKGYEPCLGIRPYLIKSVREMLKIYAIEQSNIIRTHKVIFEKAYIEKHGDPNPPKCISNNAVNREGEVFEIPGSSPIDPIQPFDNVVAMEIRDAVCWTVLEHRILDLRSRNYTLDEISVTLEIPRTSLYNKIVAMQRRCENWRRRNA